MSQLVETGEGVAEFPDEMSHDEIAGVIKKQFYSPENPPPQEYAGPGSITEEFGGAANPAAVAATTRAESLAPIPQIPQQEGILKQTGAALVNAATAAVNFATSPTGLQTLPLGLAEAPLSRLLGAAFAPEMITEGVKGAIKKPTLQGKLQSGLGALLGFGGAVHASGLTAKLAPISKEAVQEVPVAPVEAVKPEEVMAKPETLIPQEEVTPRGQAEPVGVTETLAELKRRNGVTPGEVEFKSETPTPQTDVAREESGSAKFKIRGDQIGVGDIVNYGTTGGTGKAEVLSVEPYESSVSYKTEHAVTVRNPDGTILELRPAEHYGISLSESKAQPVSSAERAPVASSVSLPENVEVTIKASTSKGEELEVKLPAREAEKVLNERKTALEQLIDCLGA